MLKIIAFIAALYFCIFIQAWGSTSPAEELIARLDNTKTLQTDFVQKITDEKGHVLDEQTGELILAKPNRFYWHVKAPAEQKVISDGEKVWVYDPNLEQVVIKPMDQTLTATPIAILSGSTSSLKQDFTISRQGEIYQLDALEKEGNFKTIFLQFNHQLLTDLILVDHLDQRTTLHFSHLRLNGKIQKEKFIFIPSKEVDVVDLRVKS